VVSGVRTEKNEQSGERRGKEGVLLNLLEVSYYICGLGSSVGIATGYGLDGPGIESRWG
jgi:hypothetical protein